MKYHVATGIIHVHTTDSDGTKSHEEIAAIGNELGLDFLMFADHMTLQSRHDGKEGFYDNLLVLIGYEHNDTDDCNHYLIFDNNTVYPAQLSAPEYVEAAARDGALGIIAHPDEIRGRDVRYRSYPWTAGRLDGIDGIEIWNQMSEWMENLKSYNKIKMIFSPRRSLKAPTRRVLHTWDEYNADHPVVGIASADAHGFRYRAGLVRLIIFPYKVQFKTLRTHVMLRESLSRDFETAKRQLLSALRGCRVFVSNYKWGDAAGFAFEMQNGDAVGVCGDAIPWRPGCTVNIHLPRRGLIRLIGDGRVVKEVVGCGGSWPIDRPGIYRLEVYRRGRGWIFSNHIRVSGRQ